MRVDLAKGTPSVAERKYDDEARDRLAAIRARRGTPERQAKIEALQASNARALTRRGPAGGTDDAPETGMGESHK